MIRSPKRNYSTLWRLLYLLFPLLLVLTTGVQVSAYTPVQVTLPIEQVFVKEDGSRFSSSRSVQYVLTPLTSDSPLPAGSTGSYRISIRGNQQTATAAIEFPTPGIFSYEMTEVAPANFPFRWQSETYSITVYVKNDSTYMVTIKNSMDVKVTTMLWSYTVIPGSGGGGDSGGTSRPPLITSRPSSEPEISGETGAASEGEEFDNDGKVSGKAPQTGDESHLELWLTISILSCIGLLVCGYLFIRFIKFGVSADG